MPSFSTTKMKMQVSGQAYMKAVISYQIQVYWHTVNGGSPGLYSFNKEENENNINFREGECFRVMNIDLLREEILRTNLYS